MAFFNTFFSYKLQFRVLDFYVSYSYLINPLIFVCFYFLHSTGAAVAMTQSVLRWSLNIDHELILKQKLPCNITPLQCKKHVNVFMPVGQKCLLRFQDHLHFTGFVGTAKIIQSEMPL